MGKMRDHYYQILLVIEKRQYNATRWHCTANACFVVVYFHGAISCSTTRIHDPFLLPRSPAPNFLFSYISTSLPCICQHPLTSTMRHSTNPTTVSSLPR